MSPTVTATTQKPGHYYEEGLTLYQKTGDPRGISATLNNLGNIALSEGDYIQAHLYYEESLHIKNRIDDRRGQATCLNNLGEIACIQAQHHLAQQYFQKSETLFKVTGYPAGQITALNNQARVARELGDYEAAQRLTQTSLHLAQRIHSTHHEIKIRFTLALIALDQTKYNQARQHFITVLQKISQNLNKEVPASLRVLLNIARLFSQTSQTEQALSLLQLVQTHPATTDKNRQEAHQLFYELTSHTPPRFDPYPSLEEAIEEIIETLQQRPLHNYEQ